MRGVAPILLAIAALATACAHPHSLPRAASGIDVPEYVARVRVPVPAARPIHGLNGKPVDPGALPLANLDAKPTSDWSWLLLELEAALDSCVAHTPGDVPTVIQAWPMERGRASVHTTNAAGQNFECVAPVYGTRIDRIHPIRTSTPEATLGRPAFLPAENGTPKRCGRYERVEDDGELVGYLAYALC